MATKQAAPGGVEYYLQHIAAYEREFKQWEQRAEKVVKRYKDEDRSDKSRDSRFNVLWSNVQTLKASTFSRMPRPDVSRRFKDNDPIGRVASLILERALTFEVEHYPDFHDTIKHSVYDRFLGGRGVAWVRYEPIVSTQDSERDEAEISEDVEAPNESLEWECAPTDYVHWRDFGHSVARTWEEVTMVWRKVYMTRKACVDRFGDDVGNKVPLDASPDTDKQKSDPDGIGKRALVYEIWDKESGRAVWLSKSLNEVIDERDDPLGLEEFFPCPRPLYATVTNDSLVPVPDFALYQDQANQLNIMSSRIDGLVKALQVRGVYDASEPTLARLFSEGTNTSLIPVENWAAFAEKQGLKGAIDIVEIAPIAQTLREAYMAFEQLKAQIYEISGISDIIRGNTAPEETATAQQIKGQYASLRLKVYQDEVSAYASHLLQLKAEIICNHFDPQTIARMACVDQLNPADQQFIEPALQLLRDNPMRTFRVQVAADSMVYMDEQGEKQDRMEFLQATSDFIAKLVQASQTAPEVMPLGVEMLKFGVHGFRVGKTLEGVIDKVADQIKQQAAQPKPPQPDPEQVKAQAAQQQQQMQQQHEQQMQQQQIQHDQALEQYKTQTAQAQEAARAQADQAIAQAKAQQDMQLEASRQAHEKELAALQAQVDDLKSQRDLELKKYQIDMAYRQAIEVAEISAATTLKAAQVSAAKPDSEGDAGDVEPKQEAKTDA